MITIIGCSGFLGSRLASRFADNGLKYSVCDINDESENTSIALPNEIEINTPLIRDSVC